MYRSFMKRFFKEKSSIYEKLSERVKEELDFHVEIHKSHLISMLNSCESPIEQLFVLSLNDAINHLRDSLSVYGPEADANFWTQKEIVVGGRKYRADFLLVCETSGKTRKYVIECDGHNFHEKTKEQAARDRERERKLMTTGYTVIRFTGSEIWKDPTGCVKQAIEIINSDFRIDEAWQEKVSEDIKEK